MPHHHYCTMNNNIKWIFCGMIFTGVLVSAFSKYYGAWSANDVPQMIVTDTMRTFNELDADKHSKHIRHYSVDDMDATSHNVSVIRECLPEERLNKLQTYCKGFPRKYKISQLEKIVSNLWVDDVNKVLMCTHAKAGCTTWKIILANNTSDKLLNRTPNQLKIHTTVKTYGIKTLDHFTKEEIEYRLKHYYKFMVVRHPFDRLQSAFMDKFVLGHEFTQKLGPKIMSRYHANLPESTQREGNISFSDLIHWIQDGNRNEHWDGPYHLKCNPCLIDYDRIVKLETQQSDSEYVIFKKLQGRSFGIETKHHSKPENLMLAEGKLLQQFANCTSDQIDFLINRLQMDFNMFGYSFDIESLQAKCGDVDSCC